MIKKTHKHALSLEKIDAYLDRLAQIITINKPRFNDLLPLYERLEAEQKQLLKNQDTMTTIINRAKVSLDQKAAQSF